ncbi:MAG TPA: lantibiotic dehydratase [Gaiellaceae bacterium]|nr:lantibiotic dehydratase [Gaiellaceae bacterium]
MLALDEAARGAAAVATDGHLLPFAGDWALWRDFAVRSAGFPVSGLDVFGTGDESARLAEVATDAAFGEAVIWQNRSAYRTAVAKIAGRGAEAGSKRRQRDGVVAGYWQRYCSKNDTVGFFGGLAWGTIRDEGPAVAVCSRGLIAEREVHFESWCLEALAQAIRSPAVVPLNRRPDVELREQLDALGDQRGLRALDRLEHARTAVARAASCEELLVALDAFDETFERLTGAPPVRSEEAAEGGRTPLYLDCMRGLDVHLGPAVVSELAGSLPVLFEASRWWCGRVFAHAQDILAETVGNGLLEAQFDRALDALWQLPRLLAGEQTELQDRCSALLAGDDATIARRAEAVFADHGPAWPLSVFQSADVQIAAADLAAIDRGDFLAVVGDFHPGNPLTQSLFSTRFPDPDRFRAIWHADVGHPTLALTLTRNPSIRVTSRNIPDAYDPDDIHLVGQGIAPIHIGVNSMPIADLTVRGQEVVRSDGSFRAPLADLFFLPMFITAMTTFEPFPGIGPRLTVGRTVLRRASWRTRAAERPVHASDIGAWARGYGLPRRVFCLVEGEAKPVYVDFQSPALTRNLHRMLARAAAANPHATVRFSEMLPEPDQCWLEHQGARYTSELRLVAVDSTRRGGGALV